MSSNDVDFAFFDSPIAIDDDATIFLNIASDIIFTDRADLLEIAHCTMLNLAIRPLASGQRAL